MASSESIFPIRDSVETDPTPETVSLDEAGDVMDALTAKTARTLVDKLYEEPATASDLAAATDTSLQNVQHHLEQLQGVDLIEVVDTWYSEKGREMAVYGPTNDPMVIVAGGQASEDEVRGVVSAWH